MLSGILDDLVQPVAWTYSHGKATRAAQSVLLRRATDCVASFCRSEGQLCGLSNFFTVTGDLDQDNLGMRVFVSASIVQPSAA